MQLYIPAKCLAGFHPVKNKPSGDMPAGIPGHKFSIPGHSQILLYHTLSPVENGLNYSPMKIIKSTGALGRDVTVYEENVLFDSSDIIMLVAPQKTSLLK